MSRAATTHMNNGTGSTRHRKVMLVASACGLRGPLEALVPRGSSSQRSPLTRARSRIRENTCGPPPTKTLRQSRSSNRTKTRPSQTELGSRNDGRSFVCLPIAMSSSTGRLRDHDAMFILSGCVTPSLVGPGSSSFEYRRDAYVLESEHEGIGKLNGDCGLSVSRAEEDVQCNAREVDFQ